ncbi:MAG: rRNA methyltransferase [Gordonia sp. (in: high G+C Gram-positive bacteria)]
MRCPVCGGVFEWDGKALRCALAHSFDIARQGYVALRDGRSAQLRFDTADMVAARCRVHQTHIFDPVVGAVATGIGPPDIGGRSLIVDLGAGPGHYLHAALLQAPSGTRGLGVDLSKFCARTLARTVPNAAAVVADIWRVLPIATGVADAVLSVFAPRNIAETIRILRPGGRWTIVTPQPDHLAELIAPMDMLSVGADKADAVAAAVTDAFEVTERHQVRYQRDCDARLIADLVAMGPSAFHRHRTEIDAAAAALTTTRPHVPVTIAVTVTHCRLRAAGSSGVGQASAAR